MLAKRADLRWRRSPQDLQDLIKLQVRQRRESWTMVIQSAACTFRTLLQFRLSVPHKNHSPRLVLQQDDEGLI